MSVLGPSVSVQVLSGVLNRTLLSQWHLAWVTGCRSSSGFDPSLTGMAPTSMWKLLWDRGALDEAESSGSET